MDATAPLPPHPAPITPGGRRFTLVPGTGTSATSIAWVADAAQADRDAVTVVRMAPARTTTLPIIGTVARRLLAVRTARRATGAVRQLERLAPRLRATTSPVCDATVPAIAALANAADVMVLAFDTSDTRRALLDREIRASSITTVLVPPHAVTVPNHHKPIVALSSSGGPDAVRFGLGWAAAHDATLVAATFLPRRDRADEWAGADPAVCLSHEQLTWDTTVTSVRGTTGPPVIAEVLDDDLPITLHRLAHTARLLVVDRTDFETWRTQLYEDLLPHGSCALAVLPANRPG